MVLKSQFYNWFRISYSQNVRNSFIHINEKVHFTVSTSMQKIVWNIFVNTVFYTSHCILKMGHVLPALYWKWAMCYVDDNKEIYLISRAKEYAIQIMIWFCQSKLFLMKKFEQSKKGIKQMNIERKLRSHVTAVTTVFIN